MFLIKNVINPACPLKQIVKFLYHYKTELLSIFPGLNCCKGKETRTKKVLLKSNPTCLLSEHFNPVTLRLHLNS